MAFEVREKDRRKVGVEQDYPGSYEWPIYEYRCPICKKWSSGSDVTVTHNDETESVLCEKCASTIEF